MRLKNCREISFAFYCIYIVIFHQDISRAQQINFSKSYLEYGIHQAFSFAQLPDTGYIITGYSNVTNLSPQYAFAMHINKFGDTLWTRTYALDDKITGIILNDDSTCMVTGGFYQAGGSVVTIAKMNFNGDTILRREYGNPVTGRSIDIYKTMDNGYIMRNSTNACDYGVIKLDSALNVQWHNWHSMANGYAKVKPDIDSGYIVAGGRNDSLKPYGVARLDSAGGIIWQYAYGNGPVPTVDGGYATDLVLMDDSNYLVGTNGSDWQLMKIDRNTGDTLWTRSVIDSAMYHNFHDYAVMCMDYGGNNTYLIGGSYMMLVDANGDSIWKKSNPFLYGFLAYDTHRTSDGGFAFCGSIVNLNIPGFQAIAFVKLDSLGNTIFTSVYNPENCFQPLTFFPNPANMEINVSLGSMASEKNLLFTLYDLQGKTILAQQPVSANSVDISTIPEGLYIATVKGKKKEVRGKVMIQR